MTRFTISPVIARTKWFVVEYRSNHSLYVYATQSRKGLQEVPFSQIRGASYDKYISSVGFVGHVKIVEVTNGWSARLATLTFSVKPNLAQSFV